MESTTPFVSRSSQRRPHACVQLRQDDLAGTLYNLVGFQTNLKFSEQKRVFGLIPGLADAQWERFGQMHRNTFLSAPSMLEPTLQFRAQPHLLCAGQLTGIEGYAGNIASGLLAGWNAARLIRGEAPLTLPPETMLGALCHYVSHADVKDFQPMKSNMGLLPALPPPEGRRRNRDWEHLHNSDVVSMPDTWEYPWFAAWDLAFHMIPVALIDAEWAKRQMVLLTREWYMHPNGQLPAYEWAFDDVNPPVHAWAAWRVYQIDRKQQGEGDTEFLEKVFHKMLLNFTWWVNRKDRDGNNVFQGGFLGLDNIGVFDRSKPLPTGGYLEQADGTAWMGMFCLNMLAMALELAKTKPAYEDVATKFFEHFVYIAHSINRTCGGRGLWDEADGFYYDTVHCPSGARIPVKLKSFVGLIPLFAVETIDPDLLEQLPDFTRRMEWFINERPQLLDDLTMQQSHAEHGRILLSLVNETQLRRILDRMLDPNQFLSDYGLRSLSKEHDAHPYTIQIDGSTFTVRYEPGESQTGLFGGNSNWRGPVWFPVNYLMIESLQKYHHYYGDALTAEMPHGSDTTMNLWDIAAALSQRLIQLFLRDDDGRRPVFGDVDLFQTNPHWPGDPLFYEYFHGDTGAGLGASHQTGWTALVAKLIQQSGEA